MKRRNQWRVRQVEGDWWVERRGIVWGLGWWVVEVFDTFPAAMWLADQRARM